jgi:hypothetical protein
VVLPQENGKFKKHLIFRKIPGIISALKPSVPLESIIMLKVVMGSALVENVDNPSKKRITERNMVAPAPKTRNRPINNALHLVGGADSAFWFIFPQY